MQPAIETALKPYGVNIDTLFLMPDPEEKDPQILLQVECILKETKKKVVFKCKAIDESGQVQPKWLVAKVWLETHYDAYKWYIVYIFFLWQFD